MSRLLGGALLLFAVLCMAQQQGVPSNPPYTTPPTFPKAQQPSPRTPPDMPAPREHPDAQTQGMPAGNEVAQQIQKKIDTEPLLKGSTVKAAVDDGSVTLTGTVDSEQEHDIALRIAKSYAGKRDIVDKIKIRS